MDVDAAWTVVAGVLIASTGPFITGRLDRNARKQERREQEQRDALHAVQDVMYEYLVKSSIATIDAKTAPATLSSEAVALSASLIRITERIRDD